MQILGYGSLAASAVGVTACSPPESKAKDDGSGAGGDLGDTMTLATWPNYDDPALIQQFTEETGVNVQVQVYGSTEEMESLLRAGNSGIDVAVPSQYAIPGWISSGLLKPIDYDAIEVDLSDWNKAVVDQEFDPGTSTRSRSTGEPPGSSTAPTSMATRARGRSSSRSRPPSTSG